MSLSREQIEILENQYLVGLYDEMEREIIADIARRVKKTGRFTETAEIMARDMREQGYSPAQIQKEVFRHLNKDADYQREVAENTKAYKEEVKQLIAETEAQALAMGNMLVAQAGDMAWNDDMQMWKAHGVDLTKGNELSQLVEAVQRATGNAIQNITGTTGTLELAGQDANNAYRRELDLSLIKMATGAFSFNQAYEDVIKRTAKNGLMVVYQGKNGAKKRYHLDTAARMCLRTGMAKLSGAITQMNMQKTKTDLVYVDAHAGSRPEHAVWQGKVYVYNSLNAEKYPEYGDFFRETDYGSVTGLQGVNCMHNWYPYWPGDPIPEFSEPEPVVIDGEEYTYYECTQEQRRRERDIRQMKRDLNIANAIGDKELAGKLTKQIKLEYNSYTRFSYKANLRPKYERIESTNYTTEELRRKVAEAGNGKEYIVRFNRKAGSYPTSNEEIKDIMSKELRGVRFSAEPVYNSRIRDAGQTRYNKGPLTNKITAMYIGRQTKPGRGEIIDTLLHEELEARIILKAHDNAFYDKLDKMSDNERHIYINKVIAVAFRIKGINKDDMG